jgi:type II secretory pathway pseudopilin PulG
MRGTNKKTVDVKDNEAGFSLIELMISAVLLLIVTGAVLGLLELGRMDRNRASRSSDTLKNARAAMHLIGRDALNAGLSFNRNGAFVPDNFLDGHLGIDGDDDTNRDLLTAVIAGNNINTNGLMQDTNGRTDVVSFVYRDLAFNNGAKIELQEAVPLAGSPDTPVIVTLPNQASRVNINDLFIVESDSTQVAVMATGRQQTNKVVAAPADPLGMNQPLNESGSNVSLLRKCVSPVDPDDPPMDNCTIYNASMKKMIWIGYFVREDGTLIRKIFGNNGDDPNNQVQEQPLAYGIENMQISYVLADGTVMEDPVAGVDGIRGNEDDVQGLMNSVRQVTVTLTVQSRDSDEQTGAPRTITLTSSYSTRNLEYDAG